MTTKPLDLAQFEGHTPGPWRCMKMEGGRKMAIVNQHGGCLTYIDASARMPNYELIAAAPALLAECRRLQAENAKLREALERCADEAGRASNGTKIQLNDHLDVIYRISHEVIAQAG